MPCNCYPIKKGDGGRDIYYTHCPFPIAGVIVFVPFLKFIIAHLAVEHGQRAVIQIRQPQHSATVIRLDSLFAHGDGLPCRRIGTTADRQGDASIDARFGLGVLSAMTFS
jgi:hypothetical protein